MSSSYRVYVGPYFKCTPTIKQITRNVRACQVTLCSRVGQEVSDLKCRFCPYCSAAIKYYDVSAEDETPSTSDVDLNDRLYPTNNSRDMPYHCWVPNVRWPNTHRSVYIFEERVGDTEIPGTVVGAESVAFDTHFALEKETLKRHYGPDKVSLCWGVIGEYV